MRLFSGKDGFLVTERLEDGATRHLFGLENCGDFVHAQRAISRHTDDGYTLTPDVALAAYLWLGQWLASQGIEVPAQLPARV